MHEQALVETIKVVFEAIAVLELTRDFRLDEPGELYKRFLPSEVTHLDRNSGRYAFLHNIQIGAARNLPKRHRDLHFSGQVWIIEPVRITNDCIRHQLPILTTE